MSQLCAVLTSVCSLYSVLEDLLDQKPASSAWTWVECTTVSSMLRAVIDAGMEIAPRLLGFESEDDEGFIASENNLLGHLAHRLCSVYLRHHGAAFRDVLHSSFAPGVTGLGDIAFFLAQKSPSPARCVQSPASPHVSRDAAAYLVDCLQATAAGSHSPQHGTRQ